MAAAPQPSSAPAPLVELLEGDARAVLATFPADSVHCVVTSPPYWGLRTYGTGALVWGGDPACAHAWDAEPILLQAGKGGNWQQAENGDGLRTGRPQTRFRGDVEAARAAPYVPGARATCTRCGAWLGELGHEATPEEYVAHLVEVFRSIRRVLRHDGVVWLNLGDSYAHDGGRGGNVGTRSTINGAAKRAGVMPRGRRTGGLRVKNLALVPFRAALALQADGWYVRTDVIWEKSNPLPESVRDRPTRSHEYVFLLAKGERYYYDPDAVRVPHKPDSHNKTPNDDPGRQAYAGGPKARGFQAAGGKEHRVVSARGWAVGGRNLRTVWNIAVRPYRGAHFATFPPALAERCLLLGTSSGGACERCGAPRQRITRKRKARGRTSGNLARKLAVGDGRGRLDTHLGSSIPWEPSALETVGWRPSCRCGKRKRPRPGVVACTVLDPFGGSGTVGAVAVGYGRRAILIDLNPAYLALARERIGPLACQEAP